MVYFSFIGFHDQTFDKQTNTFGATLTILQNFLDEIEKVYLFATRIVINDTIITDNTDYVEIAEKVKNYLEFHKKGLEVNIIIIDIPNPIDFDIIYSTMYDKVTSLIKDDKILNDEKIINITSGTPTMSTCWVLLNKSGAIPNSRLIQSFEKKYQLKRKKPYQFVDLEIDNFPQINSPSAVKRQLTKINAQLEAVGEEKDLLELDSQLSRLVGYSPSIRGVKEKILNFAPSNFHVLIIGDAGTGKQIVAEYLYKLSLRSDKRFRDINIGGKTTGVIESELFGHKKGAFTGASTDREGLFLSCDGGTIFIDEFGDIEDSVQKRLLKVIEYGTMTPLGSDEEKNVNVRIIAATNQDLPSLVEAGKFRRDLISRFTALIQLEPLNQRTEDIPELIDYFVGKHNLQVRFSDACIEAFMNEDWSVGNVRQLENVVKLSDAVFTDLPLERSEIPSDPSSLFQSHNKDTDLLPRLPLPEGKSIEDVISDVREYYYSQALSNNAGNAEKAAQKDLGMKPHTLRVHLREHFPHLKTKK